MKIKEDLKNLKQSLIDNQIPIDRLNSIENLTNQIKTNLNSTELISVEVELKFESFNNSINVRFNELNTLIENFKNLSLDAKNFTENAAKIDEHSADGALNLTLKALEQAKNSEFIKLESDHIIVKILSICHNISAFLDSNISSNESKIIESSNLDDKDTIEIDNFLLNFNSALPNMSQTICGTIRSSCDDQCGGIGCKSCGVLLCDENVLSISNDSVKYGKDSENFLKQISLIVEDLITSLSNIESAIIHKNASENYKNVTDLYNSLDFIQNYNVIKEKLENFSDASLILDEIQRVANNTLNLDLNLDFDEITELAKKIDDIILTLTNVDEIIANTSADLERVNKLKINGFEIKDKATELLKQSNKVIADIDDADNALANAKAARELFQNETKTTEQMLGDVS